MHSSSDELHQKRHDIKSMNPISRIFSRLFRRSQPASAPASSDPVGSTAAQVTPTAAAASRNRLIVASGQSTGIERSHNEDALLLLNGYSVGMDSHSDFGVFIVADGMGGHRAGEVASAVSIRTVARKITEHTVLQLLNGENDNDSEPLQDQLRQALEEANQAVVDTVPGGGTTLTVAILVGNHVTIGHVGDSRAYFIQNGKAEVITRDHSLVERLRELGQLTEEEAAVHPQRNVLYRAIGQGANLEVDVFSMSVPKGGYMLICSDGLWGVVPDPTMLEIVHSAPNPQTACDQLVQAANFAGGPDNISVVLVQFPEE
ncbi:MAG: serine/threonine-protein phosphatase [Anaerolineales bacterium]|nr:MAG: serine/threonine-protein phosphatase [Anaerolineales bacterium]